MRRRERSPLPRWAALLLTAVTPALGPGCATLFPPEPQPLHGERPPGRWHRVAAGETLGGIAAGAGVPLQDLMEINGITDPDRILAGQYIYVLSPTVPSVASSTDEPTVPVRRAPLEERGVAVAGPAVGQPDTRAPLAWPLAEPSVTSGFGSRWGRPHEGIDLAAPAGTPVLAAADGEVVYAGDEIRGYGNLVVLRHAGDLLTVYAHNSVLLVMRGDRVTRGQVIARVGQSGRATAPHLHFEVRRDEEPVDPIPLLPRLR